MIISPSIFDFFACRACGHTHGAGFLNRPVVRSCEGSWLDRLLGRCPPKAKGTHFHVLCSVCGADNVTIKKEMPCTGAR